jgi:hypothetical protein
VARSHYKVEELRMRLMFAAYVAVIVAGVVGCVVIGLQG